MVQKFNYLWFKSAYRGGPKFEKFMVLELIPTLTNLIHRELISAKAVRLGLATDGTHFRYSRVGEPGSRLVSAQDAPNCVTESRRTLNKDQKPFCVVDV